MNRNLLGLVLALSVVGVACAPPDVVLGSGGDGATAVPVRREQPPAERPYLTGPVVSVSKTKPVTNNCVPPDPNPDPNAMVSSDDPPVCNPNPTTFGSIHLKGHRADQGGKTETVFSVTKDIPLVRETQGAYEPVDFDDIEKGDRVSVWITGMVLESYPTQVEATFIVVRN